MLNYLLLSVEVCLVATILLTTQGDPYADGDVD